MGCPLSIITVIARGILAVVEQGRAIYAQFLKICLRRLE